MSFDSKGPDAWDDDDEYVMVRRVDWEEMGLQLQQLVAIIEQLQVTTPRMLLQVAAAVRKPGRSLSPSREKDARSYAAYDVEHSTEPPVMRALHFRDSARRMVEIRQYQWAGLYRRAAEIIEARFQL